MTAAGESRMWSEFFLSLAMARDPATVCVQQDRLVSDPLHDAWYGMVWFGMVCYAMQNLHFVPFLH